jgi:hypothetical protein
MSGSSPLSYVTGAADEVIGFIFLRGRSGHEAFDREQRSLGLFTTPAETAAASLMLRRMRRARDNYFENDFTKGNFE